METHPPFLIGEAIRFGWHKTRAHSGLVFQVVLTLFALQVAHSIVGKVLLSSIQGFVAMVVLSAMSIVLTTGATVIALKIARGTRTAYRDIIPPLDVVIRYFLSALIAGIAILIGLILLVVPGIYLMLRYSMVRFAAIEASGAIEALRESGRLTRDVKGKIFLFLLTLLALNLAGALLFFVGLLITVPISMIAYAHVYEKLRSRVEKTA
jgi:uncharacterized membrane protein